jgi:hypothetical protein
MSVISLADRATAERLADIAPTACKVMLVNREEHRREFTKGGSDA